MYPSDDRQTAADMIKTSNDRDETFVFVSCTSPTHTSLLPFDLFASVVVMSTRTRWAVATVATYTHTAAACTSLTYRSLHAHAARTHPHRTAHMHAARTHPSARHTHMHAHTRASTRHAHTHTRGMPARIPRACISTHGQGTHACARYAHARAWHAYRQRYAAARTLPDACTHARASTPARWPCISLPAWSRPPARRDTEASGRPRGCIRWHACGE